MKRIVMLAGAVALAGCGAHPSTARDASLPPMRFYSADSANHQGAFFAPDWSHVYWWQPNGAGSDLWMADTTFANAKQLEASTVVGGPLWAWSRDGSRLAVATNDTGSGVSALMVMSPDGSNTKRLAVGSGLFVPVDWAPDNDRLDYIATSNGSYQSFTTSVRQGGVHPLVPGETRPYLGVRSPDGRSIVYQVTERGRTTIWVTDSAGQHPRQVTTDGFEVFAGNAQPWSPDSKWIAYESRRTGTTDVWVAAADSGAPRQLTHDVRNDWWPLWSPDGRWIAFNSDRGHQNDIWVVPAAGGAERRVTNDTLDEDLVGWRNGTQQLAYLTGQGGSALWRVSVADGTESRLTGDSITAGIPHLSPDGSKLAFRIARNGGSGDIAVMPAAGGPMHIVFSGGSTREQVWSPDGSKLAIVSDRAGTPDVWIVDLASNTTTQLINWPGNDRNVEWSVDGGSVYFVSDRESSNADVWRAPIAGGDPVRITHTGNITNIATHTGVEGLYAGTIERDGHFHTVRLAPDGKSTDVWTQGNSFAFDVLPAGDSVLIGEIRKNGSFGVRLVPAMIGGDGIELLKPREFAQSLSHDGKTLLYITPNGATTDIAMVNRAHGTIKRLTTTTASEDSPVMTPDGKYVIFRRFLNVRRVAVADLARLLGGQ